MNCISLAENLLILKVQNSELFSRVILNPLKIIILQKLLDGVKENFGNFMLIKQAKMMVSSSQIDPTQPHPVTCLEKGVTPYWG
jgi:hypothetical protein